MASKQPKSTSVRTRTSTTDVTAFMARLDHPLKAEIEALRTLIRSVDPRIQERIKWNAPSFAIHEDFATFKLYPAATVQVVLHTGAKGKPTTTAMAINDPDGLLNWAATDRCVASFIDMHDISAKQTAFVAIVRQWIDQL